MPSYSCAQCGKQVPVGSERCPHCGTEKHTRSAADANAAAVMGCLALILVPVLAIAILSSAGDTPAPEAPPAQRLESVGLNRSAQPARTVMYTHTTVNIRRGPGTAHAVVGTVVPGEPVYAGRLRNGWQPVFASRASRDTVGYIAGRLLFSTPPPDLQLLDNDWKRGEYGNVYATGRIRNNTGRTYSYVQVSINVYDANGVQIGNTLANVNNLRPGSIWQFEAIILEDAAVRYTIEEITGF